MSKTSFTLHIIQLILYKFLYAIYLEWNSSMNTFAIYNIPDFTPNSLVDLEPKLLITLGYLSDP